VIHIRLGLAVSVLLLATVAAASDWPDRVRDVVPSGVTLTELEETPGSLRVVGFANGNADVAALLRALLQAQLGRPELQQVEREGDRSRFVLRIEGSR